MSKINANHILGPDVLAEMNAEFHAGEFDKLEYPENPLLDPASDPFERNYDWLNPPPAATVDPVLSTIRGRSQAEWASQAGRAVRELALGGSLAGGNDAQVFDKWISEGFLALCLSTGDKGEAALAAARSQATSEVDRVLVIKDWLATLSQFAQRTEDERLAVAIAAALHFSIPAP